VLVVLLLLLLLLQLLLPGLMCCRIVTAVQNEMTGATEITEEKETEPNEQNRIAMGKVRKAKTTLARCGAILLELGARNGEHRLFG
jgi:hypothetical protein